MNGDGQGTGGAGRRPAQASLIDASRDVRMNFNDLNHFAPYIKIWGKMI
jgi:hypothetical protein